MLSKLYRKTSLPKLWVLFFIAILPLTSSAESISKSRLPTSSFRLPASDFRLPTSDFRLPTSSPLTTFSEAISKIALIPKPVKIVDAEGFFEINAQTTIAIQAEMPELATIADYLKGILLPSTGLNIHVSVIKNGLVKGAVSFELKADDIALGEEGYRMIINTNALQIIAYRPAGLFRAIQTLRQLLPDEIEAKDVQNVKWAVPCGEIVDYPSYSYRGSMLDIARHFFDVSEIKQYIDLLTAYKMNILHLHLSDDQGWRIEIKSWPELTITGSLKEVGGGPGGFLTQVQYLEIVNYAAARYITIVPEIDMPGHTNAALASYAELNCDDKKRELYTGTKVGFSTLCVNKEITYDFIDDVIRELAALTSGPYIHIGGDESLVTKKEDYIYFINRVQGIVAKYGKTMIGWEEVANTPIKESNIAQFWSKPANAKAALAKGVKLIFSPASKAYLDMKYHPNSPLGLNWAGYVEVDTGYDWDPLKLVPGITKDKILGIEAPLWSETVSTIDNVEFLAFPRLPGYAEIGWSPAEQLSWPEYKVRLGNHALRMKWMGINFYQSTKVPWVGLSVK